ncbi:hypothetical protein SKAU_G00414410 [Synaphobranchus kaupii]|uniref:Uncharacterized protein n=1 Tax=Synaphobranchus kaupii TaxID=118154 RepID=A0A9Q1I9H2_SYNKA|nr:hypothetical protein SKAU_G00414410 [Synaphobranchus kaupii]
MRCVSGERRRLVCPLPDPDTSGAPHRPPPMGGRLSRANRRSAALGQTPHLPLSPERVAPGASRALDARSESPLSGLASPPHRSETASYSLGTVFRLSTPRERHYAYGLWGQASTDPPFRATPRDASGPLLRPKPCSTSLSQGDLYNTREHGLNP